MNTEHDLQAEYVCGFQEGQQDIINKLPRYLDFLCEELLKQNTFMSLNDSLKEAHKEILNNKLLEVFNE